ncbi:vitamin B6 transporter [Xylogone sp. PMI_703]|nr:vitamin B6 transporter [Xylogone sp. PMI_703]
MANSTVDEEKGHVSAPSGKESSSLEHEADNGATQPLAPLVSGSFLQRLNDQILSIKFLEKRGIERVPESERHEITAAKYMQVTLLWFSTNITANNIAVGMLGPLSYDLGFTDSALCVAFGAVLGAAGVAYMSTFGPESGNRTMVIARYFMGYYPSKICCLLNIVIMLGYGMIDCLVGGQVLSAVGDNNISVVGGIIIVAAITWFIVVFGMSAFQIYEKWAWAPQLVAIFVLVGSAGLGFDTSIASTGNAETINGNRLSFFSLCLSSSIAWAPAGADYFVYYPPSTQKWKTFSMTLIGIGLAIAFANLIGVGLASGTFSNPAWQDAYNVSSGALIMAGYGGLGGFGKFLGVIVALGLIANNVPGTYSAALGFQIMGRYLARLPRWFVSCIAVLIYTACALGGRNHLFDIFENFLALMGYWVTIWLTITLEEHLIFRRTRPFDWDAWADRSRLPLGLAALAAFLVGWAGSIISMYQIWYVGPIAKMVGEYGADLGIWVGVSWAMIVYPPLRYLELKKIGR